MITSVAAKFITCSDGRAQPPQPAPMITPNGRGRRTYEPITSWEIVVSSCATISVTIRCRNRRSASSASTSPSASRLRTHQEPRKASACQVPGQPGRVQPGQPPDHRIVRDRDRDGGAAQAAVEDHDRQHDQHDQSDQPADAAGLQMMGQRRCLTGGSPTASRPPDPMYIGAHRASHLREDLTRGGSRLPASSFGRAAWVAVASPGRALPPGRAGRPVVWPSRPPSPPQVAADPDQDGQRPGQGPVDHHRGGHLVRVAARPHQPGDQHPLHEPEPAGGQAGWRWPAGRRRTRPAPPPSRPRRR